LRHFALDRCQNHGATAIRDGADLQRIFAIIYMSDFIMFYMLTKFIMFFNWHY